MLAKICRPINSSLITLLYTSIQSKNNCEWWVWEHFEANHLLLGEKYNWLWLVHVEFLLRVWLSSRSLLYEIVCLEDCFIITEPPWPSNKAIWLCKYCKPTSSEETKIFFNIKWNLTLNTHLSQKWTRQCIACWSFEQTVSTGWPGAFHKIILHRWLCQ